MWNDDDVIYGDGEWITWTEINSHLERLELKASCSGADIDLMAIFKRLLDIATDYYRLTGRHLQVYGDLGELYGAITYGIKLHRNYAQGSDGRMGNDLVEIKTITPLKTQDRVILNLQRNFSKVLIVKIDAEFNVHGKLVARKELPKVKGDRLTLRWSDIDNDHGEVQSTIVALTS